MSAFAQTFQFRPFSWIVSVRSGDLDCCYGRSGGKNASNFVEVVDRAGELPMAPRAQNSPENIETAAVPNIPLCGRGAEVS